MKFTVTNIRMSSSIFMSLCTVEKHMTSLNDILTAQNISKYTVKNKYHIGISVATLSAE